MKIKPIPFGVFILISFVGFWAIAWLLGPVLPALPLILGALIPGVVAAAVISVSDGKIGLRDLFHRLSFHLFRWPWAMTAVGIPLAATVVIWLVAGGLAVGIQPAALSPLLLVIYVVALFEEIGWRGYAFPRLLTVCRPWVIALLMGCVHALYHLPLWLAPGMPVPLYSFPAFFLASLGLGILWIWLYQRSGGSILITTMLHGTLNAAGNVFFAFLEPSRLGIWLALIFLGTACFVFLTDRRTFLFASVERTV